MISAIILATLGIAACAAQQPITTNATIAQLIAVEAYVYFYPIITMDVSRRQTTNSIPSNVFMNLKAFPTASSTTIVRPNFDTLYSTAWLDLTSGPIVLSVPDTNGRYYLMPLLDMWTDVFAVPGWRTSGTGAGNFAILPPGWTGSLPAGVSGIQAPTPFVWLIGRTQTNGVADYPVVNALQAQYNLTRLSEFGGPTTPFPATHDSTISMTQKPLSIVNGLGAQDFFTYATQLLNLNGPHLADWSQIARLSEIGIAPGQPFNWNALSSDVQAALNSAVGTAQSLIASVSSGSGPSGWQVLVADVGVYGNSYLMRAYTAAVGLGANQPNDAIYPILIKDANGNGLTGNNCYQLTFAATALPPAQAFWSVTMYTGVGYPVQNSINRYALHNWDPLTYNADGSLTIYIQSAQPSNSALVSNWLPGPASGPLGVTMRLYAPLPSILNGQWTPPLVPPTTCV
jgi:hypothetical protein